jgi:hypothetical protein
VDETAEIEGALRVVDPGERRPGLLACHRDGTAGMLPLRWSRLGLTSATVPRRRGA